MYTWNIYNLQKARIIECSYVNCLKNTAYGTPLSMCVTQRDYAWCSYVYGEMFNLIPFASIISDIAEDIKLMLQQPAQMIGVGINILCELSCTGPQPACRTCLIAEGISLVLDLLCDFGVGSDSCEAFWDDFEIDDEVCEAALED